MTALSFVWVHPYSKNSRCDITLREKLKILQGEYLSALYLVKMDKIVRKGSKFETFWVLAVSQKARISQLLFLFAHSANWSLGKVKNGSKLMSLLC